MRSSKRRIERDHVQPALLVAIARADRAGQPVADVFGQQDRVFRARGVIAERFQDRAQLADRHRLAQQHLQDLLHFGQLHHAGDQFIDHGRRGAFQFVDQMFRRVAGENFVGVLADGLGQMRGDHAARLDHGVAEHLGLIARRGVDPHGGRAEGRLLGGDAGNLAGRHAGIDRQEHVRIDRPFGHRHVGDLDAVLVLLQSHVVADADLGQNHADFGGHVLPHALDAFQQIAAAFGIGQADQAHADFDFHRIDRQESLRPALRAAWSASAFFLASSSTAVLLRAAGERDRHADAARAEQQSAESAAGW